MGFTLACRDLGATCDFIAEGETVEDVIAKTAKHAKKGRLYVV